MHARRHLITGIATAALLACGAGTALAGTAAADTQPGNAATSPDPTPMTLRAVGEPFEVLVLTDAGDGYSFTLVPGREQTVITEPGGFTRVRFAQPGESLRELRVPNQNLPSWCTASATPEGNSYTCGVVG